MVIVSIMEKIDDFDWSAISKKSIKNGYFIKMVLKIAEYHDKIHFDLSSFFLLWK